LDSPVLTVAAPAYLERKGRPAHPHDLCAHDCIRFRDPATGRPFDWEFHRQGEILKIDPPSRLLLSDAASLFAACVAGAGVSQVLGLWTQGYIDRGELVVLFPEWSGETYPLYALYPSRHLPPAKVRAFIDFCLEEP
ncbi:MAG TPA: substrate binding domain-containing protein, partial [Magnetospirillaceae bacterium]|nr:substrate binding domain-containing protein [Magnetospirillaceae bacterium]